MAFYRSLLIGFLILGLAGCATTKRDWEKTQTADTVSAYQEFLSKHPQTEFSGQANTRIEQLNWGRAQEINTIEAYETFLQAHKRGKYAEIAKARMEALRFQQADKLAQLKH